MNNLDPQTLVLRDTETVEIPIPETWSPPTQRRRKPRFEAVPASTHLALRADNLTYRKERVNMLAHLTVAICIPVVAFTLFVAVTAL